MHNMKGLVYVYDYSDETSENAKEFSSCHPCIGRYFIAVHSAFLECNFAFFINLFIYFLLS